jgi:hypothetical protein
MIHSLSVKIPSQEELVEKNFHFLYSKPNPIINDNSLWGSVIYEIWSNNQVYNNLYSSIKHYVKKVDSALYNNDFSHKTTRQLELTKNIIIEGIKFCGEDNKNGLLNPLKDMLVILKKYIVAKELAKKEKF